MTPLVFLRQVTEGIGRTVTYAYDALYRLTSETVGGTGVSPVGSVAYTLDKVGNRESRTSSVSSVPSAVNSFNSRDQLNTDSYDTNGNTKTSSVDSGFGIPLSPDIYDFEDRLIVRTRSDGTTINLSYDADGIRKQKSIFDLSAMLVSATGYLVDTNNLTGYGQVVEEYRNTSSGTAATVYSYGSSLISQSISLNSQISNINYFGFDGLGSVRALTNSTGTVTDTWDYDAFGIVIRRTGTTTNNYLYRGEQFDPDLGMYSLRARFYNQSTGRFWNQDTYEGSSSDPASLHKYLYANADPVAMFDPSGHDATLASFNIAQAVQYALITTIAVVAIQRFGPAIAGEAQGVLGEVLAGAAEAAGRNWLIANYESVRDQIKKAVLVTAGLLEKLNPKFVPISRHLMPDIARNVETYQGGKPQLLERVGLLERNKNRRDALRGKGSAGPRRSWDEYPFASSKQGGFGSSVVDVPQEQNWLQGGIVGAAYYLEDINVGDQYWAVVIP